MDFEDRVNKAIEEMIDLGYKPKIFISMMAEQGTIEAIKTLIHSSRNSPEASYGFTRLWELNRLDLSMENIIQEPQWKDLFSDEDRKKAKERLQEYGYKNVR